MWLTGLPDRHRHLLTLCVSILVVVDVAHRLGTVAHGVKPLFKFQSLLWWMWLTGGIQCMGRSRDGVVSILVVVDVAHRPPRRRAVAARRRVSILVVVD